MFIAPMNPPAEADLPPLPYELVAGIAGSPFDYPLSSRFDETTILVMDKVFIPWENVLIYRDFERCKQWFPPGRLDRLFPMRGLHRLAVKLDFITGALYKACNAPAPGFRGVQAQVGEVVAWRNLFWSLTDAMYGNTSGWHGGAFLPSAEALQAYRVLAPQATRRSKKTHRAGGRQRPDLPPPAFATCTIRNSTSTSPPIAAAPAWATGSGSRSSSCSGTPSAASSAAATSCTDQLRRQPGRDPHAGPAPRRSAAGR